MKTPDVPIESLLAADCTVMHKSGPTKRIKAKKMQKYVNVNVTIDMNTNQTPPLEGKFTLDGKQYRVSGDDLSEIEEQTERLFKNGDVTAEITYKMEYTKLYLSQSFEKKKVRRSAVLTHFREHFYPCIDGLLEWPTPDPWIEVINDFDDWRLQKIQVDKIYLYGRDSVKTGFDPDDEIAEERVKELLDSDWSYDAIIVDKENDKYNTIDGGHRARAAFLRGDTYILAYVGVKKNQKAE